MSNQALHTTIRQVVEKHGQEILSDLRLMYILSDYGAFDKLSNEHAIVKDLQTQGYGQLLLNCKNNPDTDWQTEAGVFINDFLTAHPNYDSAEVLYICDSIAYGVDILPESSIRKNGGAPKQSSSSSPIDYAAELKRLQNEFLSLLKSSIVIPEGKFFKKPSGYYPIDAQNMLYFLEKKICMLGQELGQDLASWCKTEKQRVLDENTHPIRPQRLGLISAIAVPSIIVIVLMASLISFIGARKSVSAFNHAITRADSLLQAKDFTSAIDVYKLAGDSYQESYNNHKFKKKAKTGIQKASLSLAESCMREIQPLYKAGNYYEALLILNSLPDDLDCSSDKKVAKDLASMRTDVVSNCEILLTSEIDSFVNSISKNKGKLSNETLERIDYLLTVDPSNYWLNFIKNKSAAK